MGSLGRGGWGERLGRVLGVAMAVVAMTVIAFSKEIKTGARATSTFSSLKTLKLEWRLSFLIFEAKLAFANSSLSKEWLECATEPLML